MAETTPPDTGVRRDWPWRLAVAGLALAGTALLLLCPLPAAWEGGWRSQFFDLGHVPLFAGLTLVFWWVFRGPWYWPILPALAVAGLAEVVQESVGRSGNVADFLRGGAGILAAAFLIRAATGPRSWRRLVTQGLLVAALVAGPVIELGPRVLDAAEGYHDFPTLSDFRTSRQLLRWSCQQAELIRVPDPDHPGSFAGRITFLPGPDIFPGVALEHVCRDFTGYQRLCWSFTVEEGPLTLVFSLRGGPDGNRETSHFQFAQTFGSGVHQAKMDLNRAAARAQPATLDMSWLWCSQVFIVRAGEPHAIHLHRVWLE
jgi:hypothetical protein